MLVVVTLMIAIGGLTQGATSVSAAARQATEAAEVLDAALTRKADLSGRLVALAGADPVQIQDEVAAVRAAEDIDAALAASESLGDALAVALASTMTPASQGSDAYRDLMHELRGADNRISVATSRWQQAHAGWEHAAGTPTGWAATTIGLAQAPPAH